MVPKVFFIEGNPYGAGAELFFTKGGRSCMNILVMGGTRFFGVHLVKYLLLAGHEVTIATRQQTKDPFGSTVKRIKVDRTDRKALEETFAYRYFEVVIDDLAYCARDVQNILDTVRCRRYIMVSSASVYELHFQTVEEDFRPEKEQLVWYGREEASYPVLKKSAECALVNAYGMKDAAAVRFPYVAGPDDYTGRLLFYVEHMLSGRPMYIDNPDSQMSFISSDEAGKFLTFLAGDELRGPVNACSRGTVSIREIMACVEKKTGKAAVLSKDGDAAPYNGTPGYSISTKKAEQAGFQFTELKKWLYDLLDHYIEQCKQ